MKPESIGFADAVRAALKESADLRIDLKIPAQVLMQRVESSY